MKKRLSLLCCLMIAASAFSQAQRPVVGIMPFAANGITAEEGHTIENLVQSYVSEMDSFRLVAVSDRDRVLSEIAFAVSASGASLQQAGTLLAADYLLSGSVGVLGDNVVLTLDIIKVKTGEKKSLSSVHKNLSDLALGSRTLVYKILAQDQESTAESASMDSETINPDHLTGTWKGDKGIEMIRILGDGKAVALLSSGVQMELSYAIEGLTIRFTQTSPNTERFYHPLPYAIAKELKAVAKPMEWEFRLYDKGTVLRGIKRSTSVRYEGSKILETQDSERAAEWVRPSR